MRGKHVEKNDTIYIWKKKSAFIQKEDPHNCNNIIF